jgi:flagellar protein FlaG
MTHQPSKPAVTPSTGGESERQAVQVPGEESGIVDREAVSTSVSRLNDYARSINRDLKFTIDEELKQVIVRVYNAGSDELIRQFPSEEVLVMARHLARNPDRR